MFPFNAAWPAILIASIALAGCSSEIFSYSDDRCNGAYNQCANVCKDAPYGGVEAACLDRCLADESRCYAVGPTGDGSNLAEESLVGYAKSRKEKEAAFRQWKARKERERAAAAQEEAAAGDVEVLDEPGDNP